MKDDAIMKTFLKADAGPAQTGFKVYLSIDMAGVKGIAHYIKS